jgi:hypothetical protein
MKGKRIDRCAICGDRGSGYRRVAYPFQETGHSEKDGVFFLTAFSIVYPSGAVCWKHNYQRAVAEPEQCELFPGGHDEHLPSAGAL